MLHVKILFVILFHSSSSKESRVEFLEASFLEDVDEEEEEEAEFVEEEILEEVVVEREGLLFLFFESFVFCKESNLCFVGRLKRILPFSSILCESLHKLY